VNKVPVLSKTTHLTFDIYSNIVF